MSQSATETLPIPFTRRAAYALLGLTAGVIVRLATAVFLETPVGQPGYFTTLVPAVAGHIALAAGLIHMIRHRCAPTARFWFYMPLGLGYVAGSLALRLFMA